jgi:hypothetical protein
MHVARNLETHPANIPVGEIKTFGPVGPKYEVLRPLHQLANGDWLVMIRVIATGEEAEYELSQILDDPQAA